MFWLYYHILNYTSILYYEMRIDPFWCVLVPSSWHYLIHLFWSWWRSVQTPHYQCVRTEIIKLFINSKMCIWLKRNTWMLEGCVWPFFDECGCCTISDCQNISLKVVLVECSRSTFSSVCFTCHKFRARSFIS
jgi:hypothetical protein